MPSVEVEFAELHRIDVFIQGVECSVKCLEDSGAQIRIIKSDVISNVNVKHVGTVKLHGIFGSPVDDDLIQLRVKTFDKIDTPYTPVIVAMCDSVYEETILPCDTVKRLFKSRDSIHATNAIENENVSFNECSDSSVVDDITMEIVDTVNDDDLQVANAETLKSEQLSDESLTHCWALAKSNKGDYFVHDGLL